MSAPLLTSLSRAGRGVMRAFATEANVRRHAAAALFVLALLVVVPIQAWQAVAAIIVTAFVFVVEFLNTAIERLVDLVKPQFHELAREAKDIAAGAVLVSALAAVAVGLILFGPYALFLIRHV